MTELLHACRCSRFGVQSIRTGDCCKHHMASTGTDGHSEEQSPAPRLQGMPRPWFRQLIRDCLVSKDRLQLFGVSKASAATVVEHSPHIKMHCMARALSTEQMAAKKQVMKALLSPAAQDSTFHVTLDDDGGGGEAVPVAWEALPKTQVTHLELYSLQLTSNTLKQLQLQHCTSLRTLRLMGNTGFIPPEETAEDKAALSEMRATCFPPSLTELRMPSYFNGEQALGDVLGHQITSFIGGSRPAPSFNRVTHFHYKECVCRDCDFDSLLTLPPMTHVTIAPWLELNESYWLQNIRWQQLLLQSGTDLRSLVNLPVWCIQHLIVQGQLHCDRDDTAPVEACIAFLGICPRFQCKPKYIAALNMRMFWVGGQLSPELISMCAHRLTEPCCLFLSRSSTLLASLPLLSDAVNVTCLGLSSDHYSQVAVQTDEQLSEFWQQVFTRLPAHITHIALDNARHDGALDAIHHASLLVPLLQSSPQHQKTVVKVMLGDYMKGVIPQQLQELMRNYPGQVQADQHSMQGILFVSLMMSF